MTSRKPVPLDEAPSVLPTALHFAGAIFRHKSGRAMIYAGVAIFIVGNLNFVAQFFAPGFPTRASWFAVLVVCAGIALAGSDVATSFVKAMTAVKGSRA